MLTLSIIAKQPQIPFPSYALRALMKQILEGMRAFHSSGFVHRDIKCDNILLHSPPGSGRVYAKISDFGFAKKEDTVNEQTYVAGTIPFMAPELFKLPTIISQKVDMYAIGIIFYKLITHEYPVDQPNAKLQGKALWDMPKIERLQKFENDILWNLLSKLLEFDPIKRITAAEALQHSFFSSLQEFDDISPEQQDLALQAAAAEFEGNENITQFDKDPTFIVSESTIKLFIQQYLISHPNQENLINNQNIQQKEEFQTI
ncbi:MAG: putative Hsp70 family protein with protein kinase domain [Streblomastix strix]|uniref:Putative Hsp70 family protein with protein kinase domain n=1 Tax=Streblomastix strix TaxID=222440 RepID=A0A5J4UFM3_9EUKA|nr:MAG: putative Hsp70 family protein with protein kinase domain [Streblomastix strix]